MRYIFIILIIFFTISYNAHSQDSTSLIAKSNQLKSALEKYENVPQYKFRNYKNDLPYQADNSIHQCFPPMRSQMAFSCHQMSAAYFTFTYELNRLRNTSAGSTENQMSELFTYNFFNGGSNTWGVPYPDSWEASKVCGNASVKDFTNDTVTGHANAFTWMYGYEKYLRSLANKTENFYAINTSNVEGLEKIKQWLFHHDENSETGGLLNCILGGPNVYDTLPEGSQYAGEILYRDLGAYLSHGVTIVGYNDSVCFDYNNDGLFTNNLDINSDGVIDVRDYEMGAFKVAETFGPSFGNSGFLWLPYRHVATPLYLGGIWNYSVHLLNVKEKYSPQLTAKINLSHQSRNTLRIRCGFASDTNAVAPEKIYDYPVFCFQGGDFYMTGGSNESDKTIEFAIDISPMLSDIKPEEATKFFLEITEKDEHNLFQGTINEFAIISHINDSAVFTTGNISAEIENNTTTLIPIIGVVNFNKFYISDSIISLENCSSLCEKQITAVNGNPPFSWSIPSGVTVAESASLPVESDFLNVTPFDLINGTKEIIPGFDFPFFDSNYSKFYVSVNGFIYFEESLKIWPYLTNSSTFLKQFRIIAPFLDNLSLFEGDSIWYYKNDSSITINWKSSKHLVDADSINVEFSVTLRNNGDIYFSYKDIDYNNFNWLSGFSSGNNENYFVLNNLIPSPEGKTYKITYVPSDERFTIDDFGNLSFNPIFVSDNDTVMVLCEDYEERKAYKTLRFFENEITENSVLIFPNPSFNELYFNILVERDVDVSIKFFDFAGRSTGKVFTSFLTKGKHNILVNTESLSPGLYFCKILIGNVAVTRKIVKL